MHIPVAHLQVQLYARGNHLCDSAIYANNLCNSLQFAAPRRARKDRADACTTGSDSAEKVEAENGETVCTIGPGRNGTRFRDEIRERRRFKRYGGSRPAAVLIRGGHLCPTSTQANLQIHPLSYPSGPPAPDESSRATAATANPFCKVDRGKCPRKNPS